MTLYDLIINAQYQQVFHVYVTNAYDQNVKIGSGTRKSLMDEEECAEGLDHLMDKVDRWEVCSDGSVFVALIDHNFKRPCEELYNAEYVAKWDRHKPQTRPWRYSSETELNQNILNGFKVEEGDTA